MTTDPFDLAATQIEWLIIPGAAAECIDYDVFKFGTTLMPASPAAPVATDGLGMVTWAEGQTGEVEPTATNIVTTLDNTGSWDADCIGQIDNDSYTDMHFMSGSPVTAVTATGCSEAIPAGQNLSPGVSWNIGNDVGCEK